MRHLAITGMETASMISRIFLGDAMRATPPSARICAGTRSSAITETAPAFSAMIACSALVTSMMTPPFNISARPVFRRKLELPLELPLFAMVPLSFLDHSGSGCRPAEKTGTMGRAKDNPGSLGSAFLVWLSLLARDNNPEDRLVKYWYCCKNHLRYSDHTTSMA